MEQKANDRRDIELWTHFASSGSVDKNTMLAVTSWLIGLSATAIGYIIINLIDFNTVTIIESKKVIWLALLGAIISLVSWYISLLYGGYANDNWAKAAEIANKNGWYDLIPYLSSKNKKNKGIWSKIASRLAKPKDHSKELAPVFLLFMWLSIFTAVVHFLFISLAFKIF